MNLHCNLHKSQSSQQLASGSLLREEYAAREPYPTLSVAAVQCEVQGRRPPLVSECCLPCFLVY